MYAAIRAKAGDHAANTLARDKHQYEVLMTPEQIRDTPLLAHVQRGLFALMNLNTVQVEWVNLNEQGWVIRNDR